MGQGWKQETAYILKYVRDDGSLGHGVWMVEEVSSGWSLNRFERRDHQAWWLQGGIKDGRWFWPEELQGPFAIPELGKVVDGVGGWEKSWELTSERSRFRCLQDTSG